MTTLKAYDKIRLKTGQRGSILEIFKDGTFLAELFEEKGGIVVEEINASDIKAVIREIEEPLALANA